MGSSALQLPQRQQQVAPWGRVVQAKQVHWLGPTVYVHRQPCRSRCLR